MAHLLLVCGSSKEIQDARVSLGLIPNLVSLRLSFLPIKQHIQISLEHALRLPVLPTRSLRPGSCPESRSYFTLQNRFSSHAVSNHP